jgi:hypothetical protein
LSLSWLLGLILLRNLEAGWNICSHLCQFSNVFQGAEINSFSP